MTVPPDDQPFRKAIDSTLMLTLARFFMPVVVAVLGYFLVTTLGDLKDANRQVWIQLAKIVDGQAQANAVQSGLSVRVDGAVKQLDRLQMQVDGLQRH